MRPAHAAILAAATLPLAACWQTVEPFTSPAAPVGAASAAPGTDASPAPAFPAGWVGTWQGELVSSGGAPMRVRMALTVAPAAAPDRWTWTITYDGEQGHQERPYQLVANDAASGRYAIEARNGIVIPARWIDGVLYTDFQVDQSRIACRQQVVHAGTADECLLVELSTTKASSAQASGGGAVAQVTGWTPDSVQRGVLRRAK